MGKNKVTFGKTSVKRLIMLPVMILGIVSILSMWLAYETSKR